MKNPYEALAALGHHRWSLPILAELDRQKGSKFVTLVRHLDANQAAVRQALDSLMALRLVKKNPGYGHPMRPEYILTDAGLQVARSAGRLLTSVMDDEKKVIGNKWSLPILLALGNNVSRFSRIKELMPAITQRALTLCLKELQASGLIERRVAPSYPPTVAYALSPEAELLLPLVEGLSV